MTNTIPEVIVPSLDAPRRPIRDYAPEDAAGHSFRAGMLGLTDLLEELRDDDEGLGLESEVVWTALHAFPGLIAPGPPPAKLLELVLAGVPPEGDKWNISIDAEAGASWQWRHP